MLRELCSVGCVGSRGCSGNCASWRGVWGAGDVLRGGMCGEQRVLRELCSVECVGSRGCLGDVLHGRRDGLGDGDVAGAVLHGKMCGAWGIVGELCWDVWGALGCTGTPGGCAVWSGAWNAVPRVVVQGMPRGL